MHASGPQQDIVTRQPALSGTTPPTGTRPHNRYDAMMSVIALSLPEMVILRKVLKVPLLLAFAGIVGCGILLVGFLFNLLL